MLEKFHVSIVIPVHNAKNYIFDTIESVFLQKGNLNLELIVVDDASSDNSVEIIKKCFSNYSHLKSYCKCECKLIQNKKNLGVAKTRNIGIENSNGEYIAFLDSDDLFSPYKLQKQLDFMIAKDAILTCTGRELIDEIGVSLNNYIQVPQIITYKDLLKTNTICCSSVIVKKQVLNEFEFEHDEFHEDYYLWLRILKKYNKVYGLDLPLIKSRMTIDGKSRNKIKSAKMHYNVYKLINLNCVLSVYYFIFYILNGLKKYYLKKRLISFYSRQIFKMTLQHVLLPLVYFINKWRPVDKDLVIFADAHHKKIPFNMKLIKENVEQKDNIKIKEYYLDFATVSSLESLFFSFKFMKDYSRAGYVFICDNFLPISSCKKKKATKVVQLWHACGALKKFGYDAKDDIPDFYKGHVYKNYNLVTVSSEYCIAPFKSAMKQKDNIVRACGISRTDYYFNKRFIERAKDKFYKEHRCAKGKKIVLWAPTFRGNAIDPYFEGSDKIKILEERLKKLDYFLVTKFHPHYKKRENLRTSKLLTEELITLADFLITDYSSVLFDFLLLKDNLILFNPDLFHYQKNRGFYLNYEEIPAVQINNINGIYKYLKNYESNIINKEKIDKFRLKFLRDCFGSSTVNILKEVGL
jgi:CDP-glycerol glycerophosphotransferase (TagB/SpsB family)